MTGTFSKHVLHLTSLAAGSGVDGRTWSWISVLARPRSLQSLKIGRLIHHEAQGLAEGVARLRLINLEIHSSPWVKDQDPRHHLAGGETYDSPLMFFFYSLIHRNGPSHLSRGLRSTLETFILRDRFHIMGRPTKQMSVRAACSNCQSLRRIESTHPTHGQACEFFSKFGWRLLEESFGETKLASLENAEQFLGKLYNGVTEFQYMPSSGPWKFAFVRDPDDILETKEDHEKGRSKDTTELRTAVNDGNGKHT